MNAMAKRLVLAPVLVPVLVLMEIINAFMDPHLSRRLTKLKVLISFEVILSREQVAEMLSTAHRSSKLLLARASCLRWFSNPGSSTQTPPPNAARGATADLCDIYITRPVDEVCSGEVQIAQPVFR